MKVIAVESLKAGILRKYGEGELIPNKVPNCEPFNQLAMENPCILLENGKYVWGFQCWWGETSKFYEQYKSAIIEEIVVEIEDEVLPV